MKQTFSLLMHRKSQIRHFFNNKLKQQQLLPKIEIICFLSAILLTKLWRKKIDTEEAFLKWLLAKYQIKDASSSFCNSWYPQTITTVFEADNFPLWILLMELENLLWNYLGWDADILFACQKAWKVRQYH